MILNLPTLTAVKEGRVKVAFRRWKRPTVKAGGTLTTRIGVLAIDSVDRFALKNITPKEARAAGFDEVAGLKKELAKREGTLYRVSFHLAGVDPRIALRSRVKVSADEVEAMRKQVERWDKASRTGPWALHYLKFIQRYPGVRAGDLADKAGLEKLKFKANVRKLKAHGLTESLEVGYRLSPRGRAMLRALG